MKNNDQSANKTIPLKNSFEEDLQKAHDFHGHICTGIIFGTKIARIGLSRLGIEDPHENKDFIVFVEADRCIADAVSAVTGCFLGKRRLKWLDYGKMAATFVDMNSQKGIRIVTASSQQPPDDMDLVTFWSSIPDEDLFRIEEVTVMLKQEDLPGRPSRKVTCADCGESVMDGRDLLVEGKVLCKACANGAYYIKG
ncbi:MAG: FmdE family protein [Syntrophomonadaceae bacterium]